MQAGRLKVLEQAIADLDPGSFYFRDIYGPDWNRLYVGDKVKLGREFMNLVRGGSFPGIADMGKKNAGGRIYGKNP